MGNCLIHQDKKEIKIMKMDGKILEYQLPLKVHQVLTEFPGHAISDGLPLLQHLDPMADMQSGNLYYLFKPKKALAADSKGVRIKLVISKRELKEMLEREGLTLDDMVSHIQKEPRYSGVSNDKERSMDWKPALESIPEANDLY